MTLYILPFNKSPCFLFFASWGCQIFIDNLPPSATEETVKEVAEEQGGEVRSTFWKLLEARKKFVSRGLTNLTLVEALRRVALSTVRIFCFFWKYVGAFMQGSTLVLAPFLMFRAVVAAGTIAVIVAPSDINSRTPWDIVPSPSADSVFLRIAS